VLDSIVETAGRLCEAYDANLWLRIGDRLRNAAHRGPIPLDFIDRPIRRDWTAGQAFLDRTTVHVHDLAAASDYREGQEDALRLGHRTIVSTPLLRKEEAIGVLAVRRTEVRPFSEKQIAVLQTFADQAVIAIENVRLFEQVQARTRELEESLQQQTATADVLKAISRSAFDLQLVLEMLVQSATRLCDADHAWLFRRDGEFFHWVAGYGHVAEVHARLRDYFAPLDVPVNRGSVTGRAALDGKVVQVADVLADPEYTWGGAQEIGRYRAAMGVPLVRDDEVIGVIFVGRTKPKTFTEKQVDMATTFADQAVIAIENARLFEEVQARTHELQESLDHQTATSDVLNVISRAPSHLQPVFDTIVQTAARLCEADSATVFRLAADGNYHLVANYGYSPEYEELLRSRPLPPGRGTAVGRMALTGSTIQISDTLADADYTFLQAQQLGGYRTVLAVPLLREGKAIAAIALGRSSVRPFSEKQIQLVETFADQAVIAINNVALFDEVQARSAELQEALDYQTATGDVLNVISRAPSRLQPVFDSIVETAARLCQAEYALVYTLQDGEYRVAATNNTDEGFLQYARAHPLVPGRGSLIGRTALESRTIHMPDCLADPEYTVLDYQRVGKYRSTLGVPLIRDGLAIGVIALMRSVVKPFTTKQIGLVETFANQAVIAIENVRLFEQVQDRTAELTESLEYQTATSEVLNVISRSTFDLQPVLTTLVQTAGRLCQAENVQIFLRDGEVYRLAAHNGFSLEYQEYVKEHPISPGRGTLVARTALTASAIHIPDVLSDSEYTWHEGRKLAGFRSALGVPLLREGTCVGVMAMTRGTPSPFADKQIELLTTFADQAVIAIENVRLFEEVEARTAELQQSLDYQTATSDVLGVISRSPSELQPVLDAIVSTASELCSAEYAFIARVVDGKCHLSAANNVELAHIQFISRNPVAINRDSVLGRVALERQTIHVPDVFADPEFKRPDWQAVGKQRTVLGVPLMREGALLGVIILARTEVKPFTEKQIDLVTTFADQAVIAINNVGLFEQVQTRTAELQETLDQQTATSEVLKVISSSLTDTQPVFDAIVQSGLKLFSGAAISIALPEGDKIRAVAVAESDPARADAWRSVFPFPLTREYMHGLAILDRRVVDIADVETAPQELAVGSQNFLRSGYRAVTIMPMMRGEAAIGTLSVVRVSPGPLSEKQLATLRTFASQAVIAIENTRILNELSTRTDELARSVSELQALSEVSHAVNSTLELETVLDTIVAKAVQLSETDAGAIYVFSNMRQKFRLRATYGMSQEMIEAISHQRIGLGESYIGTAAHQREPLQVPDLLEDSPSTMRDLVLSAGYRGLLVVPLLRSDRIVGALVVRRREPGVFKKSTIDLLKAFAAQSVLAIQNARLFEDVGARTRELTKSLSDLRAAQNRLVQTEKLASLGQLTAGIAHEIKNPLNFVNNFGALSIELLGELREELNKLPVDGVGQISELMELVSGNLEKVVEHGRRADSIVKNMLLHSRVGSGERRPTDVNALVEESLNLAYHGARAEKQGFNITIEKSLGPAAGKADLFPQEITRVLLNLITNGFYATMKRKQRADGTFEPVLKATTTARDDAVEIRIWDNGTGIPDEVREKMFDPFFTTKPPGEGTGLGLSLSYDIVVKQHGGSITVNTVPGEFTEFCILLPREGISDQIGGSS
jgi:GAF domain-containing protein